MWPREKPPPEPKLPVIIEKTLVSLKILKILERSVDLKQLRRSLKRLMKNANENGSCLQDLLNLKNSKM